MYLREKKLNNSFQKIIELYAILKTYYLLKLFFIKLLYTKISL